MTERELPRVRDQFVDFMNRARGIEELVAYHKAEERGEQKAALAQTLRQQAYDYAVSHGVVDPQVVQNPEGLSSEAVQQYIGATQQEALREASHLLRTPTDLEGLLAELSEQQLTRLSFISDEKGKRLVPGNPNQEYEGWFTTYVALQNQFINYAQLNERLATGKTTKEDAPFIKSTMEVIAQRRAQAAFQRLQDKKHLGSDHINLIASLTAQAVLAGYHGSPEQLIPAELDELVKQTEQKLQAHLGAHPDKSLAGYLAGALTPGITSANQKVYTSTRDLLYNVARAE